MMIPRLLAHGCVVAVCGWLMAGCAGTGEGAVSSSSRPVSKSSIRTPEKKPSGPPAPVYSWKEGVTTGTPRVVIRLGSQKAYFYRGDVLVGETQISSGREGYETKTGRYKVIGKRAKHYSNLYGSFIDNATGRTVGYGKAGQTPPAGTRYEPSPMPYFIRLTDQGLGLHAGFLPGFPASHGCIRLPEVMARRFFEEIPIGAEVEIVH
jgi:lipoprotein-anchoring transpeptidase ErfK/SrfK